jgi:hypothetical protein
MLFIAHSYPVLSPSSLSSAQVSTARIMLFVLTLGLLGRGLTIGTRPATFLDVCSIPKVKFIFATALHMCYLVLYSHVALDAININPDPYEVSLFIWTLALILRECTQAMDTYRQHHSFAAYFHSFWNRLDVLYLSVRRGRGITSHLLRVAR